jgi:hypothetical protein
MNAPPGPSAPPPEDLVGSKFLASIGGALAAAVWGSVCGYFVEAAAGFCPEARFGAVLAALLLAACGAALAFAEGSRHGVTEGLGRALREALSSAWRGLWLGGLIGGAFAAGGGVGVLLLVFAAAAAGGLLGLLVGRLRQLPERAQRLNLALSLALLGGFLVAAWWQAPGTPGLTQAATAEAIRGSPVFGPSAGWIWSVGASVPLVLAVLVWWVRAYRQERAKAREQAMGLGWGLAALVFLAALAAGLGAAGGAAAQWLGGQLVLGTVLAPTPGKWLGAALALTFWGLNRQSERPAVSVGLRERVVGVVSGLLQEKKAPAGIATPDLTRAR